MTETTQVQTELRNGLRRLAKAVVVITSSFEGKRFAMAATAVSELSMEPPSLLICVNKSASISQALQAGSPFAVNILHSSHEAISTRSSGTVKGEERFTLGDWATGMLDVPVLQDAQAVFECRFAKSVSYGTHDIIIGEVTATHTHGAVDPLVYVDGRYVALPQDVEPD
jgi:flavin reductase (DIM6/NTAB) family NADH-FMN oxidoreductase RutF